MLGSQTFVILRRLLGEVRAKSLAILTPGATPGPGGLAVFWRCGAGRRGILRISSTILPLVCPCRSGPLRLGNVPRPAPTLRVSWNISWATEVRPMPDQLFGKTAAFARPGHHYSMQDGRHERLLNSRLLRGSRIRASSPAQHFRIKLSSSGADVLYIEHVNLTNNHGQKIEIPIN